MYTSCQTLLFRFWTALYVVLVSYPCSPSVARIFIKCHISDAFLALKLCLALLFLGFDSRVTSVFVCGALSHGQCHHQQRSCPPHRRRLLASLARPPPTALSGGQLQHRSDAADHPRARRLAGPCALALATTKASVRPNVSFIHVTYTQYTLCEFANIFCCLFVCI